MTAPIGQIVMILVGIAAITPQIVRHYRLRGKK